MSTSAPWNYQPTSEAQGNVKLFNPSQLQQNGPAGQPNEGTNGEQNNVANWGPQWGTENQYQHYNTNSDGAQQDQSQGQNFQGQPYDSQQFYNLNPGIHQQGGFDPNYHQQYDEHGQPIQYNQNVNQDQQQYYNYDGQGQVYDHNYGWNNQGWDGYNNQQNWSNAEGQPVVNDGNSWNNPDFQNTGHEHVEGASNSDNIAVNQGNEIDSQNVNNVVQNWDLETNTVSTEGEDKGSLHDNVLNTSGEGYDHFIPDGENASVELNQNSNMPQTLHDEISNESLVTLNSSSNQLQNSESQVIENQMQKLTLDEKSKDAIENLDSNHSATEGQPSSIEGGEKSGQKDSPVNSQTSDDWEMVPSAHNLLAPANHSRQGSLDSSSNVQFFIGSTNISPADSPRPKADGTSDKKPAESSPPSNMIPKHSSSPMPPKTEVPSSQGSSNPPPGSNLPPPPSMGSTGGNPFRKGKGADLKNRYSPNPGVGNELKGDNVKTSKSKDLKLDTVSANDGFPSPIPPVGAEDASSPNSQSQSPIMPRKESPFQPPRRRNLSQSSNSFDDDNTPGHHGKAEQSKAEELKKDFGDRPYSSLIDRKPGPLKADRSIVTQSKSKPVDTEIDYSRFSNRGKDERRPRSPHSTSRPPGGRTTPTKPPTGRTTPTKPSSGRTTPGRSTPSRRLEQAAYQRAVERRKKENVSPATSLWANNDVVPTANILLAPAPVVQGSLTPSVLGLIPQGTTKTHSETREVLSPVQNLITSMSDSLSRENSPEKEIPKSKSTDKKSSRHESSQKHERNSSIDREIEMTKRMDDRERTRENSRERYYKDDRRAPRDEKYRDDRYRDNRDYRDREKERELERERQYEAYYQRNRTRDPYYGGDERYERPRSRQSTIDDRAPSRQDQTTDRGRYDRDQYYRDKYGRGYYDYYGRQQYGYYDPRYAQDYYGDSRYSKEYYDQYYAGQYGDNYERMSRYDYSWQHAGYYDHYRHDDTYSHRSESRVHTPGSLSDSGEPLDASYRESRASSRQGYDDYHRGQYDPYYGYGYGDYYSNSYAEPEPPGRLTPEKHTIPHMCARFGPGGHLIKILPNRPKEGQTATVEIHDIGMMLEDRPEVEELKCFPGPLVRNDTHKNDVLTFCQQKAKACSENINMTDRESAELIWRLLELLIKQNGMIVGTDIADLLLQGHEPTTAEYSIMGMKISSSTDNLETDLDDTEISNITMDRSVVNRGQRSREEVTDRFRHLLMYGRKKDALEWAMKNNLWGHALFLASKMDSKAHANVMTRFANSAMKMNDPLQTLYQLMSGRQPAAVSCITDEKWGDWRPHLAMMLSNQTHKADLDRKCIMTMGDTLASRGFLHASHFCYLMGQAGFGSYHKKTSKMVLVGSNHSLSLSEFATNEAIQCSEVYEYAMSLGNSSYFSPNLQYFKYLYACRMAENGFAEQALEYCEVIAKYINISPTVFQPALVKLVFELASRLKKFDPEKQQVGEDSDDPMWLQHLQRINQGYEDGSIQPLSGSVTPYCFVGTRSSSASGEVAGLTDFGGIQSGQYTGSSPYQQNQQQMYNQGYDQSQMYGQGGYQGYNQALNQGEIQQSEGQQQQQVYTGDQNQENQSMQFQQTTQEQVQGYTTEQMTAYQQGQWNQGQQMEQHQQNQQYTGQEHQQGYQYHHDLASVPESPVTGGQEGQTEDPNSHQQQQHTTTQPTDFSMYHNHPGIQSIPGQRNSISSVGTVSSHADSEDEESLGNSQRSDFDYFGAATTGKIVAPRLRKRTESESSQVGGPGKKSDTESKSESKTDTSITDKKQGQSKGLFGGFFSKLMPKPKNEIKLPDDKDPAIVWDPVKKKWVNQDGDGEEEKPTAPPPKDMDLSTSSAPQQPASTGTPAVGPPMGNRFGRPRGRGARTQYVDVMNPKASGSSASVPSNIFNVMPTSASSPAIFNPSHSNDEKSSQAESESHQPSEQRVQSGEVESGDMPPPTSGPPSMPMLFNPAQMSQSTPAPASQPGPKRMPQRRVYPKS